MYCKNCGKLVALEKGKCPYCGKDVDKYPNDTNSPSGANLGKASGGWVFLGILVPLLGFILAGVCRNTKPDLAKKSLIGAIIGVVVNTALTVLMFASGFMDMYIEFLTKFI